MAQGRRSVLKTTARMGQQCPSENPGGGDGTGADGKPLDPVLHARRTVKSLQVEEPAAAPH